MAVSLYRTGIITLNLDKVRGKVYLKFIRALRRSGRRISRVFINGNAVRVKNLYRSERVKELLGKNWVFRIRLVYKEIRFDILLQRINLYIVGYRIQNGRWVLFNGKHVERVCKSVNTSYLRVVNGLKRIVTPLRTRFGTSYISLLRCYLSLDREVKIDVIKELDELHLKLNRRALIEAVLYLKEAALGRNVDSNLSALHIIILIFMICESVRVTSISRHIDKFYFSENSDTLSLTPKMLVLTHNWTRGSRTVKSSDPNLQFEEFVLDGKVEGVEMVLEEFSFLKGLENDEIGLE